MECIKLGRLVLFPELRCAKIDDKKVPLTGLEWELVSTLGQCPSKAVSRGYLVRALHPNSDNRPTERSIDAMACRIRKKFSAILGQDENCIHQVRAFGYALCAPS